MTDSLTIIGSDGEPLTISSTDLAVLMDRFDKAVHIVSTVDQRTASVLESADADTTDRVACVAYAEGVSDMLLFLMTGETPIGGAPDASAE